MCRTADPIADFMRRDAEQQKWLDKRPVCEHCGEPIQEEQAFYYADMWFCTAKECEKELKETIWEDIRSEYLVQVEE